VSGFNSDPDAESGAAASRHAAARSADAVHTLVAGRRRAVVAGAAHRQLAAQRAPAAAPAARVAALRQRRVGVLNSATTTTAGAHSTSPQDAPWKPTTTAAGRHRDARRRVGVLGAVVVEAEAAGGAPGRAAADADDPAAVGPARRSRRRPVERQVGRQLALLLVVGLLPPTDPSA